MSDTYDKLKAQKDDIVARKNEGLRAQVDLAIATAIGDGASADAIEAIGLAREAARACFEIKATLPPCVKDTCLYSCADDECKKAQKNPRQAELLAKLNACPDEASRTRFVMSLSTSQKAVMNWGDSYGPRV